MTVNDLTHRESVDINATPQQVYALVSDPTRMGEWSPENKGGRWLEGEPGTVGAVFEGDNELGERQWSTQRDVTVADPAKCFEWVVARNQGGPYIAWRYEIEPGSADGTSVLTEVWDVVKMPPTLGKLTDEQMNGRKAQIVDGMTKTLAGIKATAES